MKIGKDSRINASKMNMRTYARMFALIVSVCTTVCIIYYKYTNMNEGGFFLAMG